MRRALPLLLLLAGLACLSIGVFFEEPGVVFSRAAHICLECIGIG